jgi:prepilin-type processing-associated H-X9-DG protein
LQTDVDERLIGKSGPCAGCGLTVVIPLVRPRRTAKPASRFAAALPMITFILGIIALIAVSLTIVILIAAPTIKSARDAARNRRCEENLRRIAVAMEAYHSRHGKYPPQYTVDEKGQPMHSWRVLILPFLGPEEQQIFGNFDLSEPWNSPTNTSAATEMPAVFGCPADPEARDGVTSYMLIAGQGFLFDKNKQTTRDELARGDGASQTIMVAEVVESGVPWAQPIDIDVRQLAQGINSGIAGTCGSDHPQGGMHVLFADGSIKFMPDSVTPRELQDLCTISGGEIVQIPE